MTSDVLAETVQVLDVRSFHPKAEGPFPAIVSYDAACVPPFAAILLPLVEDGHGRYVLLGANGDPIRCPKQSDIQVQPFAVNETADGDPFEVAPVGWPGAASYALLVLLNREPGGPCSSGALFKIKSGIRKVRSRFWSPQAYPFGNGGPLRDADIPRIRARVAEHLGSRKIDGRDVGLVRRGRG